MVNQVRILLQTPEIIVRTWRTARKAIEGLSERDVRDAIVHFDGLWAELFPAEQARIVRLLVDRVDIREDRVDIGLRIDGLNTMVADMRGQPGREREAA